MPYSLHRLAKVSVINTMTRGEYLDALLIAIPGDVSEIGTLPFVEQWFLEGHIVDGKLSKLSQSAFNAAITKVMPRINPVTCLRDLFSKEVLQDIAPMDFYKTLDDELKRLGGGLTPTEFMDKLNHQNGKIHLAYYSKPFSITVSHYNLIRASRKMDIYHRRELDALVSNAFSFNMVPRELLTKLVVAPIDSSDVPEYARSVVGHVDTASVFSDVLNRPIEFNRESVTMSKDTTLYVGQYQGPRLEEGAKTLPVDATINWIKVSFK